MSFGLNISGIPQLEGAIKGIMKEAKDGLKDEMSAAALAIQKDARRNAPKNMGKLAQSIGIGQNGYLTWEVFAGVSYAPYLEYGTGGKVSIPQGWESEAAQYKGKKGGTFDEFVKALTLWVKRKGLAGTYSVKTRKRTGNKQVRADQDKQTAIAIAISILKKGINPQPFMIPAYEKEKPRFLKRISQRFSK